MISPGDVAEAAGWLRAGEVVIIPTDTVYGLAALPSNAVAMERIFDLKRRPTDKAVSLLVADESQAREVAVVDDRFAVLSHHFWPGPLTIVLPRRDGVDLHLGTMRPTVGVRCPDHDVVRQLAAEVGPIAVTSANLSGLATPLTAASAAASLDGPVALVIDGGTLDGTPSTVVDLTDGPARVLREGPITADQLAAAGIACDA